MPRRRAHTRTPPPSGEVHRSTRTGWLRAAVLGSDDAIVSTASLMIGVAASAATRTSVLVAGVAGLVAGAMSMAVGEYVSVSSQRDAEQADIAVEKRELAQDPQAELNELALIYVKRGLDRDLATKVAEQLSAHNRLGAHLHDELGLTRSRRATPAPGRAGLGGDLRGLRARADPGLAGGALRLRIPSDCRSLPR